jgi:hypothetical protein
LIYYLFSEKERRELEDLLLNELTIVKELLQKVEVINRGDVIKERALKEKRDLLLRVLFKITNNNQKSYNL